jgi:hypothetical protein
VHWLRHALRDFFPAALEAFEDLDAADTLELLAKAPDPVSAAKLTTGRSTPRSSRPAAVTGQPRPPRSRRRCAARSWPSRRRSPPPWSGR